jgi:hypothetical protein
MAATTLDQRIFIETAIAKFFNPDGMYDFQCKDLIDAYCLWLFGNWTNTIRPGNANECFDNANPQYFEKIRNDPNDPNQVPQYGDIVMSAGDWLNKFGHIWINVWANQNLMSVLQQNVGGYANTPTQAGTLYYDQLGTGPVIGWLRPKLTGTISGAGDIIIGGIVVEKADIDAIVKGVLDGVKEWDRAMLLNGYEWGGVKNPGLIPQVLENQRLIKNIPNAVLWGVTDERRDADGKKINIPFIQDMANIGTRQLGEQETLVDIKEMLSAQDLADLIPNEMAEDVINAIAQRLKDASFALSATTQAQAALPGAK